MLGWESILNRLYKCECRENKNFDFFSEINRAGKDFIRMIQNPASDEFVETDSESAAHNEGITFRNRDHCY